MKNLCHFRQSIILVACLFLIGCSTNATETVAVNSELPEDIPDMKECASIVLRTSEGWTITIRKDGAGSYGFGTLPVRVDIKQDTFDFEQIYKGTTERLTEERADATESYIAVSYYAAGQSSATEYHLSPEQELLPALFLVARDNAIPPTNELEEDWHETVGDFWNNDPPVLLEPYDAKVTYDKFHGNV
ncbi:MAG: hypothetical protein GFH27_549289n110 [Chloroflexi bacterium AL-W]|nr:hypothetical protein [Chloroflexi bacterium AL-N1]NOK66842.1 hypothetical protein [Chloroflexi bacterium AL-N10]NOK74866.1 hypothetical protein [Chloroflexi bacterium AL-N5]NOK81445.1 hypothetical protein [Chloroflexi bacterium AL-W]NOK88914.1 hypothetical protein [Chloroflexi bacterium AL-N15]